MRKYITIGLGGFLGAILRFAIKSIHFNNYKEAIPLDTLMINLSGSFLLAFILTIAFEIKEFNIDIRLGIATGFLGAFTTFSTLCKEIVTLINGRYYYFALSYMGLSILLGLASAYFGISIARKVKVKLLTKESRDNIGDSKKYHTKERK